MSFSWKRAGVVPPSTCWKRKWQFPAPATKKTRTLKNVEQKFFTKVVLAAVFRILDPGFGDFFNPESGNRDEKNRIREIFNNCLGLKVLKLFVNSALADPHLGSGTSLTPESVIRDPGWKNSDPRVQQFTPFLVLHKLQYDYKEGAKFTKHTLSSWLVQYR